MFSVTTTTPSNFAPVSTSDMHAWLRLNDTSEDGLLSALVDAASDLWTVHTGQVLGNPTLRLNLDHWPTRYLGYNDQPTPFPWPWSVTPNTMYPTAAIYLPRKPVTAVTSVEYLDTGGTWQTLDSATWTADTASQPARVILPTSLPSLHLTQRPTVRVTFTAGYADAAHLPNTAVLAVKMLAAHWWGNREAYSEQNLSDLPMGWLALTKRHSLEMSGDWNT
jgi:hypothetical protein